MHPLQLEAIITIVNLGSYHWICAELDCSARSVRLYDSLEKRPAGDQILGVRLTEWVRQEAAATNLGGIGSSRGSPEAPGRQPIL